VNGLRNYPHRVLPQISRSRNQTAEFPTLVKAFYVLAFTAELARPDDRWLYNASTTSRLDGKEVLLEFASAELGRTVLLEELSWSEVPRVPGGVE
jgi:hypothetical protein